MPIPIFVPKQELWDETREIIIPVKEDVTVSLEHSLVSLTKWESKWCKPFLSPEEKTREELMGYLSCMILDKDVDPDIVYAFTPEDIEKINKYMEKDQTATTFPDEKSTEPRSNELMTSELIYFYLGQIQCLTPTIENWHLSRTLTLIRVASFKNKPEKKLNQKEALQQCEDINERNKRYFEEMRKKAEAKSRRI